MPTETEKKAETFWKEYEEQIGAVVLARSLGQYLSGWNEFDSKGSIPIWGLIIATSKGFRFHHFPHKNWLEALTNREGSKERIIDIPKEKIVSAQFIKESRWWLKLLKSPNPQLKLVYMDDEGSERIMMLEANIMAGKNNNSEQLADKLNSFPSD